MKLLPLIVLADDLTGAAEIAAIAHLAGLRAIVYTTLPTGPVAADVLIFDTNTRLLPPTKAARLVRTFVERLKNVPHSGIFKKTDSVLRGPVLAELKACADALGLRRTLLVPSNPSLGRIIQDGQYFISNQPLEKTAFARDPHHPRLTSDVITLLDPQRLYALKCIPPTNAFPRTGVIVGEADSPADVIVWAGKVDAHTLPAGGADFFRVWLQSRRPYRKPSTLYQLPKGGALLINGTIAAPDPIAPFSIDLIGVDAREPATVASLVAQATRKLDKHGFAAVTTRGPIVRTAVASVNLIETFVSLAKKLHTAGKFQHLLIAGGATAAAVLRELDWTQFEVVRVWGPGVVTLQPTGALSFAITMKPGSYQWPSLLQQQFEPAPIARLNDQPSSRRSHAG